MWRSAAWTVSCSSGGRLSRAKPLAALDPEQIRAGRLALKPAHQDRVHLVLDPRARADQLLAARQPPPQHAGALVGHPHRLELAPPQQARQRAGVEPVGLGARLRDPGVVGRDHHHALDVRLEDARHLPRPARDLHRHPVRWAPSSRPAPQAPPGPSSPGPPSAPPRPRRSRPRRNRGADPGRSPDPSTYALTCCTTNHLPHESTKTGEAAGQRHRPIRARGTIRASRRGGHRKARARSPSSKTACRLRSPKRPLSRITRPYARGQTEPPGPGFSCPETEQLAECRDWCPRHELCLSPAAALSIQRAGLAQVERRGLATPACSSSGRSGQRPIASSVSGGASSRRADVRRFSRRRSWSSMVLIRASVASCGSPSSVSSRLRGLAEGRTSAVRQLTLDFGHRRPRSAREPRRGLRHDQRGTQGLAGPPPRGRAASGPPAGAPTLAAIPLPRPGVSGDPVGRGGAAAAAPPDEHR